MKPIEFQTNEASGAVRVIGATDAAGEAVAGFDAFLESDGRLFLGHGATVREALGAAYQFLSAAAAAVMVAR